MPKRARPYSASRTTAQLDKFGREILNHSLFSPDLAPSDIFFQKERIVWWKSKYDVLKQTITKLPMVDGVRNLRTEFDFTIRFYNHIVGKWNYFTKLKIIFPRRKCLNSCIKKKFDSLILSPFNYYDVFYKLQHY